MKKHLLFKLTTSVPFPKPNNIHICHIYTYINACKHTDVNLKRNYSPFLFYS